MPNKKVHSISIFRFYPHPTRTFSTLNVYLAPKSITFDAVGVFGLASHLLFKPCLSPPPGSNSPKMTSVEITTCHVHLTCIYMFLLSTAKIFSKMSVILAPITHWHTQSKVSVCECYFVYKIVLTVCEKILFLKSRKTFEIPRTIYSKSERSLQYIYET